MNKIQAGKKYFYPAASEFNQTKFSITNLLKKISNWKVGLNKTMYPNIAIAIGW